MPNFSPAYMTGWMYTVRHMILICHNQNFWDAKITKFSYLWCSTSCRVAVVARSTETYTCTGRPLVAGLRWLRGVQRLIAALGDQWLQGCGGCEEYRDLYLHWETIGCRVARSTETYSCTGRPVVAGLRWLRGVQRLIPALGELWLQGLRRDLLYGYL